MPLDFLLAIMRDECQPLSIRINAAITLLPYCHAKLASVKQSATVGRSHEDWVKAHAALDKKHN
jgi:hypothetical protein